MAASQHAFNSFKMAKYSPKWIANILLVWLPGLLYMSYLLITRRFGDSWILLFILPWYFLAIYTFKKQKIPEEAKPIYWPSGKCYAFAIIFAFFFIIAMTASILSKKAFGFSEILEIVLMSYVFIPIIVALFLLAAHKLPKGYQT